MVSDVYRPVRDKLIWRGHHRMQTVAALISRHLILASRRALRLAYCKLVVKTVDYFSEEYATSTSTLKR